MTTSHLKQTLLVLALAAIYPIQAGAATSAGIAQFIAGDVNIRGADGKTDALLKGKDIESGQAIVTGANGRAQVRFSDGGLISLQPNTEFKIASYVDKADPQQDRFLVDLLRGSMRAITGLIGKRNRANYKVTTTTATIGIRGSGFNVGYNPDGSLGVSAEKDAIEVCSGGVCVGVVAGESVRVNSSNEPPVRTQNRASVPTPGSAQDVVTAGNQTSSDGTSPLKDTRSPTVPTVPTVPPQTGTFTNLLVAANYTTATNSTFFESGTPPASTSLVDGKLTAFSSSSANFTPNVAVAGSSIGTMTGGDFVGWGVWLTGTKTLPGPSTSSANRLHYVVGIPTASSLMPMTGTAAYTLIGSTAPTRYDGVSGVLSSASFSADFGTGYASASLVTTFGTVSSSYIGISGSSFSSIGKIQGNFFGANAARAGLVYSGDQSGWYFSGSAVFQK